MVSIETSTYYCTMVLSGAAPAADEGETSSGRDPGLVIHRMYPYYVYCGAGPVTGGSRGRQDGLVGELHTLSDMEWVGKGLNNHV